MQDDPVRKQAADILNRNRHLLPQETIESADATVQEQPKPMDTDVWIDRLYGSGRQEPQEQQKQVYPRDQRYFELSGERQDLQRERHSLKKEGRGVNIDRLGDISGRLKTIEGEINELKPDGVGIRLINGVNNFIQGASEVPVGLLKGMATTAKWMDESTGAGWNPEDVDEMFLYQLGERLRGVVQDNLSTDPVLQEEFTQQLMGGLGSFLSFAAGGAATRILTGSLRAGQTFAVGAAGFGGAGSSYEEAKEMGASEEDAQLASKWGFLPGIVQVSNTALRVLNRWDKAYGGALSEGMARRVLESGKSGINEAIVESLGQVGFNKIAQEIYDADRPLMEGTGQSAAVGGTAGFLSDIILTGLGGRAARMRGAQQRAPREEPKEPVVVGKLGGEDVKVVGRDEAGDVYIERADGTQKLVDKDSLEDVVEISPEEQSSAENEATGEINPEREAQVIVDPDTGEYLYPDDIGYNEALAKVERISERKTEIVLGEGRNRSLVDVQEQDDGSFHVLARKEADKDGNIIETPVQSLTASEVNKMVEGLRTELEGRGKGYMVESFPVDNTDPFSAMNVYIMPADGERAQSLRRERRLGDYAIEADGNQLQVVNPQGEVVGRQSVYYFPKIEEYFKAASEQYSKLPRLSDQTDLTEENYLSEVAQNSENPVEIAEAYQTAIQQNEAQSDGAYKEMIIAQDLAESRLPTSDLQGRGLDGAIYFAQYTSKRGDVDLGMREQYLSDQSGMEISLDDIMDFIRANPGGPRSVLGRKPEMLTKIESKFRDVTGVDLTKGIADAITGAQPVRTETKQEDVVDAFDQAIAEAESDPALDHLKQQLENEGVPREEISEIESQAEAIDEEAIEDIESTVENAKSEEEALEELTNFFEGMSKPKDRSAKAIDSPALQKNKKQEIPERDPSEFNSLEDYLDHKNQIYEQEGRSDRDIKHLLDRQDTHNWRNAQREDSFAESLDESEPTRGEELADAETKKKEELKKLFKEFDDLAGGQLSSGIDPRMIGKASEIIKAGAELGHIKFQQLANFIIENLGEDFFRKIFQNFKAAYMANVGFEGGREGEDLNDLAKSKADDFIGEVKKPAEKTPSKKPEAKSLEEVSNDFFDRLMIAEPRVTHQQDGSDIYVPLQNVIKGSAKTSDRSQYGKFTLKFEENPNAKGLPVQLRVFIESDKVNESLQQMSKHVNAVARDMGISHVITNSDKVKVDYPNVIDPSGNPVQPNRSGVYPKESAFSEKYETNKGKDRIEVDWAQLESGEWISAVSWSKPNRGHGSPLTAHRTFKDKMSAIENAVENAPEDLKSGILGQIRQTDIFSDPVEPASPKNPIDVKSEKDLEAAGERVDPEPTDGQKEAGNYKKGHVTFQGLQVTIENPKGTQRTGKASDGTEWSVTMPAHYGYVKRSEGADGEQFDVTIGPNAESDKVFVIDQIDPRSKEFDEHKGFLGFDSEQAAVKAYDESFSDDSGPQRRGSVSQMDMAEFKEYLKQDNSGPIAYQQKSVVPKDGWRDNLIKARQYADDLKLNEYYDDPTLREAWTNKDELVSLIDGYLSDNQKSETPVPVETPAQSDIEQQFIDSIIQDINDGVGLSKSQLNARANNLSIEGGDKRIKELAELAIVNRSREIAKENALDIQVAYEKLRNLYENQPSLTARTSTSIELQQYSTPAPIAYMMGVYTNLDEGVAGFEPSAGNGLLTIAALPGTKNIRVNEIDADRLDMLADQGFHSVTSQDGTLDFEGLQNTQQAIITNPPFGATGARYQYTIDGRTGTMNKLEHIMAVKALDTMRDDGKAAVLIGGHDTVNDRGMRTGQDAVFFNWLYHNYNVEDVINISGSLYAKQGASFPIRVILVNKRKPVPTGFAPLIEDVNVVDSFDGFYERINSKLSPRNHVPIKQTSLDADVQSGSVVSGQGEQSGSDSVVGGSSTASIGRARTGDRAGEQTGPSDSGDDAGAPATTKPVRQSEGTGADTTGQRSIFDSDSRTQAEDSQSGRTGRTSEQKRTERVVPREKSTLDHRISSQDVLDNSNGNIAYYPLSDSGAITTETPASMAMSMSETLQSLADEVGNVDGFVMDKLGYDSVEDLYNALAGEQIDAVALSIRQVERGKSLIVGDQTGIGKGRVAAAMIRYGRNQGMTPVFFTEKNNLFTDIHRDIVDIGSNLRPFIVNSDTKVEDQNGRVIFETPKKGEHNRVLKNPKLVSKYDYVAITYSQIQSESYHKKRNFIRGLADNALIIMDESHNASGQSNTGEYMMDVLKNAKGAVYLSATFAKRPDNMPVYAIKTDISDVAMNADEMVEAIESGGVALQEILSSDLVKSGQMVRRQRSFDGVKREFDIVGQDENGALNESGVEQRAMYDQVAGLMRNIIGFQKIHVSEILAEMDKDVKEMAKEVGLQKGVKDAGVDNTPFVSRIHNIVDQLLFSIKVDAVADEAIKVIQSNRKPVIAVKSTMEAVMDDVFTTGETTERLNFGVVMERALNSVMKYQVKDAISKDSEPGQLTRDDLTQEGKSAYDRIIEEASKITDSLVPSPLDHLVMRIEQAGFSVGEVTGRSRKISMDEQGVGLVENRSKDERDKTTLYRKFNEGELDALIINSSGATGASAHASEKFKDRRQRVMIIHQPELNINTEVQKWGRIFRTGQVVLPEYKYITSSIPAETRLMMVLKKKIKSLDANTTSSQDTSSEFLEMNDFINKYGDYIVTQYLKENTELHAQLESPIKKDDWDKVVDGSKDSVENIAMKTTGRIALLDSNTQENFYHTISEQYSAYIDMLNEYGENELIMDSVDLQAETVEKNLFVKGKNPDSSFGGNTYIETVRSRVLKKPMKKEEIDKLVTESLEGLNAEQYQEKLSKRAENYIDNWLEEVNAEVQTRDSKPDVKEDAMGRNREKADHWKRNVLQGLFGRFRVGQVYVIPGDSKAQSGITKNAVFLGFGINDSSRNPFAPSSIKLRFATNDSQRSVTIPGSNTAFLNAAFGDSHHLSEYARKDIRDQWDGKLNTANFETRMIATGNILQALGALSTRGQLIQYTTKDGQVKNGVLLPKGMSDKDLKKLQTVRVKANEAEKQVFDLNHGNKLEMSGDVAFTRNWDGDIVLAVPSSNVRGGKYFKNENLRRIVGDFTKRGGEMRAVVESGDVKKVLDILTDQFSVFAQVKREQVVESDARFSLNDILEAEPVQKSSLDYHRDNIRQAVREVSSRWANDSFVDIVDTVSDLPVVLQRQIAKMDNHHNVRGLYLGNKIYLVADNLRSTDIALKTLAHEAFGHLGLRSMVANMSSNRRDFEGRLNKLLSEVYESFKDTPELKEVANKYRYDLGTKEGQMMAAEEYLAKTAEGDLSDSLWDKIVKFVNDLLRAMGLDVNWTRGDVLRLLRESKRLVEGDDLAHIMGDGSHLRTAFFRQADPMFYSNALNGLNQITQKAGTPDQWMKMITDKGGKGTAQELEWIGLNDFLTEYVQTNDVKSVPQEVVNQYIRDNQIEIAEFVNYDSVLAQNETIEDLYTDLGDMGYVVNEGMDGSHVILDRNLSEVEYDSLTPDAKEIVDRIAARFEGQHTDGYGEATYKEHTLPGGERYREVLLTMARKDEGWLPFDEWFEKTYLQPLNTASERIVYAARQNYEDNRFNKWADTKNYRSTHFDQSNILAHVRMNDRSLVNGERVLFIEEIQSDWAQEGRKKGFKPQLKLKEEGGKFNIYSSVTGFSEPAYSFDSKAEADDVIKTIESLYNDNPPEMPYKKTDQWAGMAIRRMLSMATEQGYDRISWTTGEQQADRYDLSKQADKVEAVKRESGEYSIYVTKKGDSMKRGMGEFAESKLEEVVGKDLAEKIINDGGGEYSGVDLKVGGEGMKAFYNKLLPKIAEKEAKRFDKKAKVEVIEMGVPAKTYEQVDLRPEQLPSELSYVVNQFENDSFNESRLQEILRGKGYKAELSAAGEVSKLLPYLDNESKQLSIKLSDTAKANLSESVPLFSLPDPGPQEPRFSLGRDNLSDQSFAYQKRMDQWVRRLHDRGIAGKRLIEGVTRDGGRVDDSSDFKQDDELKRGRIEGQLTKFDRGLKAEYVGMMQQGSKELGITYEDYQDFIKARHAPDVNERFKEITGEDDRSGLSQNRIDEIESKIDQKGWREHMEKIGDIHDRIIAEDLKNRVAYGLVTPAGYAALKKMYPKYAPMRGFKDFQDVDPTMLVLPEKQEGRTSEPGDVIGYTIALVESNIIRGETNLVKEKLFNFAEQNPDFQKVMRIKNVYWRDTGKIDEATGRRKYIAETDKPTAEEILTGQVVRQIDPETSITEWKERENPFTEGARQLRLLKRGKPVVIEFSDPHIAEWLRGRDVDMMPEMMSALAKYMGFLRNAYITYSPEFPLRNVIRDGTTGVLHLATDFDTPTALAIGNPMRLASLIKPLWRAIRNEDYSGKYGKSIKQFLRHGGKSGYYQLSPLKKLTKDLSEAIDQHGSSWYKVKSAAKAFHEIMQAYTSTIEQLIRVSGYDYFLENNVTNPETGKPFSPKQAARYFKGLTVNFDKKGSWAGTIGNFWIFYNATQKGVARLAEPFIEGDKRRRTRAAAVPLIMGSTAYVMSDMLRILLGVDEDDEYRFDKINNFTVSHRIMIPNFASDDPNALISVPLPYGQNTYWAAGVYANKVMNKVMTPQEMVFHLASISWQSFNPIGGSVTGKGIVHSGLKSGLPTIFVPPFELATNVDFRGMPIVPEARFADKHIPEHLNYRYYTGGWAKQTAKALNRLTGGDEYTEGLIEVSPNALEFLVSTYLGGAGYFAISSLNAADQIFDHITGKQYLTEDDITRFPLVRVYFSKIPASGSRNSFYDNVNELESIEARYDRMLTNEEFVRADQYIEQNRELFNLIPLKDSVRRSVSNHFRELNLIPEDYAQRDQLSEELLERITGFYNEFNREYNRASGKAASENPPSLKRLTEILE